MPGQRHRLILASTSPRRQELIRCLGLPVTVLASDADEQVPDGMPPSEIVETLSLRKARAVRPRIGEHGLPETGAAAVILGSDTIVVLDNEVLGKPADREEAVRMLQRLQGRTHLVYSGVACVYIDGAGERTAVRHRVTRVHMRGLTEAQIERYVDSGEPMDKAGAYGIQGLGAVLVEGIEGDYFNVVGLPLSLTAVMLEELGISVL